MDITLKNIPIQNSIDDQDFLLFRDKSTELDRRTTLGNLKSFINAELSNVAFSGDYNDLVNLPSGSGGSSTFINLDDVTPSSYVGSAGYAVVVNSTEDGLEFAASSGGGDVAWGNIIGNISDQTDLTPANIGAATAAQGSLANTAIQPSDLATVATSGDYSDLDNLPTLGTASSEDVGVADGVTPLDSNAKIPLSFIPDSITGGQIYLGTWDADTNTPSLSQGSPSSSGSFYIVSVAGTNLGLTFAEGDLVISDGSQWEKVTPTTASNSTKLGGVDSTNYARTDITEVFNGEVNFTNRIHKSGFELADFNGFDIDGSSASQQTKGLYVSNSTISGTTNNPSDTSILTAIYSTKGFSLTVDSDNYIYGMYTGDTTGTYTFTSKTKFADDAGTLGGKTLSQLESDFVTSSSLGTIASFNASTSPTDTTLGNVPTYDEDGGYGFGLGGLQSLIYPLSSIDDSTCPAGQYTTTTSINGVFPADESQFGTIEVIRYNTDSVLQRYTPKGTDLTYTRWIVADVVSNWVALNLKPKEYFTDARDFIGDYTGTLDQSATLQAALDHAANNSGRLYLGDSGTIFLSRTSPTVVIPSGVHEIFGSGIGKISLNWNDENVGGGRNDALVTDRSGWSGDTLHLHDFSFHGPRESLRNVDDGTPSFGLNATNGGTRMIVERVGFYYCRNQAFSCTEWDTVITNKCILWRNGRGGLGHRDCGSVISTENYIFNNGDDSIFALQRNDGTRYNKSILISNNVISHSQGIRVFSPKGAVISDNVVDKPIGFGITIGSNFNTSEEGKWPNFGITVKGNVIYDCLNRLEVDSFNGANHYILVESDETDPELKDPLPNFWDKSDSNVGTWFTNIVGNTLVRTMESGKSFASQGGQDIWGHDGNTFSGTSSVTDSLMNCEGILFKGSVNSLNLSDFEISTGVQGIRFISHDRDFALNKVRIHNGSISRSVNTPCIDTDFSGGVDKVANMSISNVEFDLDPYNESVNRNANGSWSSNSLTQSALDLFRATGVSVENCKFKNCYKPFYGAKLSNKFKGNVLYCDPADTGYDSGNKGIGDIPKAGPEWSHIIVDSDPTSANYMKVLKIPQDQDDNQPTGGKYVQGHLVRNESPTAGSSVVYGWLRLTTGTTHISGTDWKELTFS